MLVGEIEPMTDADRNTTERLALLCHLSQAFSSTLDLDEVLDRVMDQVIALLDAERGFVMLHKADGQPTFDRQQKKRGAICSTLLLSVSANVPSCSPPLWREAICLTGQNKNTQKRKRL